MLIICMKKVNSNRLFNLFIEDANYMVTDLLINIGCDSILNLTCVKQWESVITVS